MTGFDLLGAAATLCGIVLGLPQLIHLIRTRRVEGLSLTAWQAMVAMNLGWSAHGIGIGAWPQITTASLSFATAVPTLYLIAHGPGRRFLPVILPPLIFAVMLILVDRFVGSAAFGILVLIPAITANAGQTVELVRAPHVNGVSPLFMVLNVVNQVLWLSWGSLLPDTGTVISATTIGVIAVVNLIWYAARRLGLRAFALPLPSAPFGSRPLPAAESIVDCDD